jgi:cytoskeletal protein RodZ
VSLGGYLRALREAKGCSLEEIARATRVSLHQLEALESDSFSDLPAAIFVKGFIRAYCDFLGEPSEEAVRRYRELLGERSAPERSMPAVGPEPGWSASPIVISLVLLLVFGGGLLAVNLGFKRGTKPVVSEGPVAKVETPLAPVTPPDAGGSTASPAPPTEVTTESANSQRLVVKAIEETWIRIQPDDGHAVEELLPPGSTREWTAQKHFLLTIGNAGGIQIELNGQPMPPLGARGAVIRQLQLPQTAAAGS